MHTFSTFRDYVSAVRSGPSQVIAFSARDAANSKSASISLPREGITSAFSGHHIYTMLQLRPGLTTSSLNEDRKKNITLLADMAQGIRNIVHTFDGALLEVQGPVVHAFIPSETGSRSDVRQAAYDIRAFIEARIRNKAGADFLKGLMAFSHGPTIFVAAEDLHGDNSIVSLAPAANAPAKVLWRNHDNLPNGTILEVETDGRFRELGDDDLVSEWEKRANVTVINASLQLPDVVALEAKAFSVPPPTSPDSPTADCPLESFSVSIRADLDGFTRKVSLAFQQGPNALNLLAQEFLQIMQHAREFCMGEECTHLPWAGDCFNLLLSFNDREEYQTARRRRILEITTSFQKHMKSRFGDLEWAFSNAAGELENAQICNTLVSRIRVGHTTLLIATGLPVERSLHGLVREGPKARHGVLWKGDVCQLDRDLQIILVPCSGGDNHRHFSVQDVQRVQDARDFLPAPAPYVSTSIKSTIAALVPAVRPYFKG